MKNITAENVTSPQSPMFYVFILVILILIAVLISYIYKIKNSTATPENIAATNDAQVALFETQFTPEYKNKRTLQQTIQEQGVSENENCLINFQPLTVIHPGYLGPLKDGVYNEREGVSTVLRMGARCFILPIDYFTTTNMGPSFPDPNTPCLMYRDANDVVRSLNGGSIAKVAQAIADIAWSDIVIQKNDPFILVLYFVNTPDQTTKEYLDFLSKVAIALEPLSPYLLGQTPEGNYNRQARQNELLFVNTNQLEKKLLVFCNADTSGFRTAKRDFNRTYLTKEDLDYWVHMRVFKQNAETPLGVTTIPENSVIPRAIVDTTAYFTNLPNDATSRRNAVRATKEKFTIALSPNGTNPSSATATLLLDTYGVQALPMILVDYSTETQRLLSKWKYAWKAKPKEIRYVRPSPITVQAQSPTVNANGGSLTIPA